MVNLLVERNIKILGVGKYLPKNKVFAGDIDKKLGLEQGWTQQKTGVSVRHYISDETSSQMGANAAREALDHAGVMLKDIDCIVCANATAEQEIPCTAVLVQKELGGEDFAIPAFDINSTCLSFLTALDTMSYLISAGRYNKILIVSSDISSVALNWEDKASCSIFGDGAASAVIGKTPSKEHSRILGSSMETYSAGALYSEIRAGGSKIHPRQYTQETKEDFLFNMKGKKLYRMTSEVFPGFISKLLRSVNLDISDLDLVIPHQASLAAMALMQKNLKIAEDKFMYIIQDHGNTVAASIPMAFYEAVKQNKISRGSQIMLMGAAAGLSVGAVILEY